MEYANVETPVPLRAILPNSAQGAAQPLGKFGIVGEHICLDDEPCAHRSLAGGCKRRDAFLIAERVILARRRLHEQRVVPHDGERLLADEEAASAEDVLLSYGVLAHCFERIRNARDETLIGRHWT
jgi:hypothetical protein